LWIAFQLFCRFFFCSFLPLLLSTFVIWWFFVVVCIGCSLFLCTVMFLHCGYPEAYIKPFTTVILHFKLIISNIHKIFYPLLNTFLWLKCENLHFYIVHPLTNCWSHSF
jgi:hypothetical protein